MRAKTETKKHSFIKTLIGSIFALALLLVVIFSYVQQNSVYNDLSEQTAVLNECKSENVRLESKLEAQASVKKIEEYAEKDLGMQKLDSSQIRYITIQDSDVVELPEKEENVFVKIKSELSDFIEYLKG